MTSTVQKEIFDQYPECKNRLEILPKPSTHCEKDIFADNLISQNQKVATVLQNSSLNGLFIQLNPLHLVSYYIPAPKLDLLIPVLHIDEISGQNLPSVCSAFNALTKEMSQIAEYFLLFVIKDQKLESYACFQQLKDGSKFRLDYNVGKDSMRRITVSEKAQICDVGNTCSVSIGANYSKILQKYIRYIQKETQLRLNTQPGLKFLLQILRQAEQIEKLENIDQLVLEQQLAHSHAAFHFFFPNFCDQHLPLGSRFPLEKGQLQLFEKVGKFKSLRSGISFADWVSFMNRCSIIQISEDFNTVLHINKNCMTFYVDIPDIPETPPSSLSLIALVYVLTQLLPAVRLFLSSVILSSLKRKHPSKQFLFEKVSAKHISDMMQVKLLLPGKIKTLEETEWRGMLDPDSDEKFLNDLQADELDSVGCVHVQLENGKKYSISQDLKLVTNIRQKSQKEIDELFVYFYTTIALSYIHSETFSLQAETQIFPQLLNQDMQNILLAQFHKTAQAGPNPKSQPTKNLQISTRQLVHSLLSSQSYDDWKDILYTRFGKKDAIVYFLGETKLYLFSLRAFDAEVVVAQGLQEVATNKFSVSSDASNQEFLMSLLDSGLYQWFIEKVGFNSWKTLDKKMPSLLYAPCKRGDVKTLSWSIEFLRQNQFLNEQLRKILFDGNNLITLVCRSEKPNPEIVRTLLEKGFPKDMLLAKVDEKNSLEWCAIIGQNEIGKILTEKTKDVKPKEDIPKGQTNTDDVNLFKNHKSQFETLLNDADTLCSKFGDKEAMLKRLREATAKLRILLNNIESHTTQSQTSAERNLDSVVHTAMICFKNLQTLHGFLSVKYADLEDSDSDEEVTFSLSEEQYCSGLFGQLDDRVAKVEANLGFINGA